MLDFIATENEADLKVIESENDSRETMKLAYFFNPALPVEELSVLLGEETAT